MHTHCVSTAAIGIAQRQGNGKLRHIKIAELWIQEVMQEGRVKVHKIWGEVSPADIFTKYLPVKIFSVLESEKIVWPFQKLDPALAAFVFFWARRFVVLRPSHCTQTDGCAFCVCVRRARLLARAFVSLCRSACNHPMRAGVLSKLQRTVFDP